MPAIEAPGMGSAMSSRQPEIWEGGHRQGSHAVVPCAVGQGQDRREGSKGILGAWVCWVSSGWVTWVFSQCRWLPPPGPPETCAPGISRSLLQQIPPNWVTEKNAVFSDSAEDQSLSECHGTRPSVSGAGASEALVGNPLPASSSSTRCLDP